jgi:hypothetical protein
MRTRYLGIFVVALVLGWSATNPTQTDLGLAAQARAKAHTQKKLNKRYQTVEKRAVRKQAARIAIKTVSKPSAPPVRLAMADEQPPSSLPPASLHLPAPPNPPTTTAPPLELQVPTPDEQVEKLRIGLEKLARTYPSPEAHMEALRSGLERLAKTMNGGRS